MEIEKALHESAARYLQQSGGMDRLKAGLVAQATLSPVPKILKVPILVNLMDVREVDGALIELYSGFLWELLIQDVKSDFI